MKKRVALLAFMLAGFSLLSYGQIQILSITSSANFVPGLLKPGSLASVFCTGLQNIPGLAVAGAYPLPAALAGVSVAINGANAPMLAVAQLAGGAYQQINIQIPWEADFSSGLTLDVSQRSGTARATAVLNGPWPVFFVYPSGYAIAQHAADYRPVTETDPARPGEWIVVYATNFGPVENQPLNGYPAALNVLAPVVADRSQYFDYYGLAVGPDANFMSTKITSNYIGMSPGSIINQVNLQVPGSQPSGDLVFQLIKIYNCGFFFIPGCGRSFTTQAASMPARIPVAR